MNVNNIVLFIATLNFKVLCHNIFMNELIVGFETSKCYSWLKYNSQSIKMYHMSLNAIIYFYSSYRYEIYYTVNTFHYTYNISAYWNIYYICTKKRFII